MKRLYILLAALCLLLVVPIQGENTSKRKTYKETYRKQYDVDKKLKEAEKKLKSAQRQFDAQRGYVGHIHGGYNQIGLHDWIIGDGLLDDFYVDIDDDVIYIESDYSDDIVAITADHELMVNKHHVDLDRKQQAMITEFYDGVIEINDQVFVIADEAAQIGIWGAGIGISAAAEAMERLSYSFDMRDFDEEDYEEFEDLQEKWETEAEKIEERSEIIEDKADDVEDMGDRLEELFEDILVEIPELRKLKW